MTKEGLKKEIVSLKLISSNGKPSLLLSKQHKHLHSWAQDKLQSQIDLQTVNHGTEAKFVWQPWQRASDLHLSFFSTVLEHSSDWQ